MDIQINGLIKSYAGQIALNIKSLAINKGETVGIIGSNGAGKTTLLRLVLDLLEADKGTVYSRQLNVRKNESWKAYTSAYMATNFLVEFLSPSEYFDFIINNSEITNKEGYEILDSLKTFAGRELLEDNKYIRNLSSGNQQKVGIIGALISKPEILILDEPFNFLDPSSQIFINDFLAKMNSTSKTTIIISSHNLDCVYKIASRLILLEKGEIVADYNQVNEDVKTSINEYFTGRM